jgi:hypothetical protein
LSALTELPGGIARRRAIDLAQPYFTGMPHYPPHAPYLYSLSRKHGEIVNPGGSSSAAEDANGLERFSVYTIQRVLRRGVLLDIARLQGTDGFPVDFVITPQHPDRASEGISIQPGDVVLLRTSWSRYWDDGGRSSGPLNARKIFAAGSETAPFEFVPNHRCRRSFPYEL